MAMNNYNNNIRNLSESLRYKLNKVYKDGGTVDDKRYNNFVSTLPNNQKPTDDFDVRRYWELNGRPKTFDEAVKLGMYTMNDDGYYHANSVAYNNNTGNYEILKSLTHPSRMWEQAAYFSNPEFNRQYYQDRNEYKEDLKAIKKHKTLPEDIDWNGIKTTNNRPYSPENISYINKRLESFGIPIKRRAAIIGEIIEESGGNPFAESKNKTYHGLLQWSDSRMVQNLPKDEKEAIDATIYHLLDTSKNTTDGQSWTHGGNGSGYKRGIDAYNTFYNEDETLENIHHAFSFGYVRPEGKQDSFNNRQKVVEQVYQKLLDNQ